MVIKKKWSVEITNFYKGGNMKNQPLMFEPIETEQDIRLEKMNPMEKTVGAINDIEKTMDQREFSVCDKKMFNAEIRGLNKALSFMIDEEKYRNDVLDNKDVF